MEVKMSTFISLVNFTDCVVPVANRPGVIAEVTTLAGRLGVNVPHIESTDTVEGRAGVLLVTVAAADADRYEAELRKIGYHPSRTDLA